MVRIAEIEAGSIAEELSLQIGTRIVRINGERVRDGIDLTFLLADTALELETLTPSGEAVVYEIEREPGSPVGIVPAPDTVRECANKCVFCFIDGNPQDVRGSLWLRDDDFRLSFTYGSYVTLTNLGPRGMQRLVDQRISPLYVSVHATEPEVRARLLVNETAGDIMERLRFLLEGGLDIHTQVVMCPGWNDGEHLERTIEDLWSLGERIRSLSVVPVGLTRYNVGKPVRLLRRDEARLAIQQVDEVRTRALAERDLGWCYSADDMYLIAGLPIPQADYYDDGALYENGVGAVRRFVDRFADALLDMPRLEGRRLRLATGRSMAPFLRERASLLAGATGAEVDVVEVSNAFFGETVGTAGLLAGADVRDALGEGREDDIVLLPAEALNADGMFIDSLPLARLEAALSPATVLCGYDIGEALTSL